MPGRSLLYDDDLLEIDPVENSPIQRVHGYLLSDGFMLATWLSNRYDPTNLYNVNNFILIIFPDVVRCDINLKLYMI